MNTVHRFEEGESKEEIKNECNKKGKEDVYKIIHNDYTITILLGLTALMIACTSLISSRYSDKQTDCYFRSNSMYSEGYEKYSREAGIYADDVRTDFAVRDQVSEIVVSHSMYLLNPTDIELYSEDMLKMHQLIMKQKLYNKEYFLEASGWLDSGVDSINAKEDDKAFMDTMWKWINDFAYRKIDYAGIKEKYFGEAEKILNDADKIREEGNIYGEYADKYNLISVIFSFVLFILGIAEASKGKYTKDVLVVISLFVFVIGTVLTLKIPLPF